MRALILRLDAPMSSFGTVMVDQHGFIDRFPGTSMLCGLVANALGWHHGDFERLQELQARIRYAARWDVKPRRLVDYHTVELGNPVGWTTHQAPEQRGARNRTPSAAQTGTHQRYRHYWTDGMMTIALTLTEGKPGIDRVREALQRPARPLFVGRKTCLPARRLLDPRSPVLEGEDLLEILCRVPVWSRDGTVVEADRLEACWPADLRTGSQGQGEMRRVYDLRDWANQIPAGSRWRVEGMLGGG